MTIQIHAETLIPSDIRTASEMIRDILAKNATYRLTSVQNDGTIFATTVKPHWWLLGTAMTVILSPHGPETRVAVEITSQPWIMGDVFRFYPRYIREFMAVVAKAHCQD